MSDNSSVVELERWKRKYYDHLDLLEKKEKSWQQLEGVLKKTILRLSLAAEGQHSAIDTHLVNIRSEVKQHVNSVRLESILEELSRLLVRLESKMGAADKKVVTMLAHQLESLSTPEQLNKRKSKLIKKLLKSSDKDREMLSEEVHKFLSVIVKKTDVAGANQEDDSKEKTGILNNLFSKKSQVADDQEYIEIVRKFIAVIEILPWPDNIKNEVKHLLDELEKAKTLKVAEQQLTIFGKQAAQRPQQASVALPDESHHDQIHPDSDHSDLNTDKFRQCLQSMYSQFDRAGLLSIEKTGIGEKILAASTMTELEKLSSDLISIVSSGEEREPERTGPDVNDGFLTDDNHLPSIQEILIRLLEQLLVQPDLHAEVESLKFRIEQENTEENWKLLLKDVAQLINTIRSRMQDEKQEFESFLQQITGRLKEMDSFLDVETASLQSAEIAGGQFDEEVISHVQDIRDDIISADDLNDLKHKVENRLNIVSDHIKQYRKVEQDRYMSAKQNVDDMQSRLGLLEQESGDLRRLILEKNKEAMFDVLTGIPNRLSYEKKAAEEIARCNRFDTALCMAVWDVDLFKLVNDTYGHKAGDRVLKAIAQLLNDRIRETDFVARYGGEEFVMFFPGTVEDEALNVSNALREKVAACKFNHHGETAKISVSCGISQFEMGDSHESMFERADRALYKAKENGRNQCVLASSISH